MWNEMQDMLLTEAFKCQIDLLGLYAALAGDETLVDKVVIHEEPSVVAQQGSNHLLLVRRIVFQTVEVVAADGEHHSCLIVLFHRVFDVACTIQAL